MLYESDCQVNSIYILQVLQVLQDKANKRKTLRVKINPVIPVRFMMICNYFNIAL